MSYPACPMPTAPTPEEEAMVSRMLSARRIAIVGLSDNPEKPSYHVAEYLRSLGKEIVPVNPSHAWVMELRSYPNLESIPGHVDLVDVFRRAEACPEIARSASQIGAGGLWLQLGITSDAARDIAAAHGMDFIQNRCLMVEHRRMAR